MGIIDKYDLDRMNGSKVELAFDCPRCRKQRIKMTAKSELDFWNGVVCPKCSAKIILDSFSLAVIKENGRSVSASTAENAATT